MSSCCLRTSLPSAATLSAPAPSGARLAGGERSGGIDWLLPAGLPFSGTSTGGLEASAEAWSGLGLSTQGVAWAESEDAARNDVAHATSTGVAVVAGWGNYLRAALWTIYADIFVPFALKNPMYAPGTVIDNVGFTAAVDGFVKSLPAFAARA